MRIAVQAMFMAVISVFLMARNGVAQDQDKLAKAGITPNQDKMVRIGDGPDQDKMVRGRSIPQSDTKEVANISGGSAAKDIAASSESEFFSDATEFATAIKKEGTALIPVDFSQAAGLSTPFFIDNEKSIGFFGPSAEASADCGAEHPSRSCLVFQNALQIQLANPIHATSFELQDLDNGKNLDGWLIVNLFDGHGALMGSMHVKPDQLGTGFMGIVSTQPFQSMVISPTGATWMLANLQYMPQERPM